MLLPTYNEDPHHVMARLRAMYESIEATGHGAQFDWFLLSDTTDPDIWVSEEMAFIQLRRACGGERLYYRHRSDNTARKSGNIADWVTRFGSAYDHMIVLDADSLMEADTIVRLVRAMECHSSTRADPDAARHRQRAHPVQQAAAIFGACVRPPHHGGQRLVARWQIATIGATTPSFGYRPSLRRPDYQNSAVANLSEGTSSVMILSRPR